MSFFSELKRRNVFRVGATYAVLAWVLMQVADILLPAFSAPDWVLRVFLFFLILGFPLALLASWMLELTPEGFKPTSAVDPALSIRHETGEKLNYITIGSVVVLLLVTLIDRPAALVDVTTTLNLTTDATASPAAVPEPAVTTITDKSIAVLPLDDFNAGGDEAYFADGLTEEILNALTRTPDLLVASRTSSFQYKDQAVDIQDVAQALGVAHILEGSVRRSAERLRVTVQLIRASDGFHLWSENYDRTPDDIIAVQEDIAFQIATALQTAMDPEALRQMVRAGTSSVAAYSAYLKGVALVRELGGSLSREAYDSFELARQIDPDFSLAHARAAQYWRNQLRPNLIRSDGSTREAVSASEMLALHEERIQRAIATAVNPERFLFLLQQARVNLQYGAAFSYARQYLDANPSLQYFQQGIGGDPEIMVQVMVFRGESEFALQLVQQLAASAFDGGEAALIVNSFYYLAAFEQGRMFANETLARFPFDEEVLYQAHRLLVSGGYVEEARQVLERVTGTQLPVESIQIMRLRQACAEADYEGANQLAAAILNTEARGDPYWQALHLMGRTQEAVDRLRPLDQEGSLYSLSSYLLYPYFDINQYPNLKAAIERDGAILPVYQPIPYACPANAITP